MESTAESRQKARDQVRVVEKFKNVPPNKAFDELLAGVWAKTQPEGPKKRLKIGWELAASLVEKGDTQKALDILLELDQNELTTGFERAFVKVKIVNITTHASFPERVRYAEEALDIVKKTQNAILLTQSPTENVHERAIFETLVAAAESILRSARNEETMAKHGDVAFEETDLGLTEDLREEASVAGDFVVDEEKKKELAGQLEIISSILDEMTSEELELLEIHDNVAG